MKASYLGLWKKLLEKDMKKQDLVTGLGISSATIAKMGKGEPVSNKVLERLCTYFECSVNELMQYVDDTEKE